MQIGWNREWFKAVYCWALQWRFWSRSSLVGVLSTLGAVIAVIYIFSFVWSLLQIGGG